MWFDLNWILWFMCFNVVIYFLNIFFVWLCKHIFVIWIFYLFPYIHDTYAPFQITRYLDVGTWSYEASSAPASTCDLLGPASRVHLRTHPRMPRQYWDAMVTGMPQVVFVCVFCCCLRWFFLRLQNLGNQLWFSVGTLGGASIKDSQVQLDPDILSGIIVHPVWLDYIRDDISRPII